MIHLVQFMENTQTAPNNHKCLNCGKTFATAYSVDRHRNRKTPCVIRNVLPHDLHNPLRCIYCNKIFANNSNLQKHHKICVIKNGGMDLLAEKTKMEQEIKILKDTINQLKSQPNVTIINNSVVNNTVNIVLNNYLKPSLQHLFKDDLFLKTLNQHLVQTPVKLIPSIWFNSEIPHNLSIYLVNKNTKETLVYDGSEWQLTSIEKVSKNLRDRAYEVTGKIITHPQFNADKYRDISCRLEINLQDVEASKHEISEINNIIYANRELVKPHIKKK